MKRLLDPLGYILWDPHLLLLLRRLMRLLEAHHNLLEGLHRSLLLVVRIEDGEEVVDMDKVVLVVITVALLLPVRDTVKDHHHRKGLGDLLLVQDMVKDRRLLVRDMAEDMEDIIMDHHLVNAVGSEITARHSRVVMVVEDITEADMEAVARPQTRKEDGQSR